MSQGKFPGEKQRLGLGSYNKSKGEKNIYMQRIRMAWDVRI